MKIQTGESLTSDFQNNTWTFEMKEDFKVKYGEFAIVEKDTFNKMYKAIDLFINGQKSLYDQSNAIEKMKAILKELKS